MAAAPLVVRARLLTTPGALVDRVLRCPKSSSAARARADLRGMTAPALLDSPADKPSHKPSSAEYGLEYQRGQAAKYRARATNHWATRVGLAMRLADEHALPRLGAGATRNPRSIHVLDIGTSIGTFAIEFARRGFTCTGLDLDADALTIARELASEEGVNPAFLQEDVSAWSGGKASVDIAVAFDLFEHLHDDELGAMLRSIRSALKPGGTLIYHTFPTEFDYIFFGKEPGRDRLWEPLAALAHLPPAEFEKRTRAYAARLDAGYLESGGVPRREWIQMHQHCNPLTRARLDAMLTRAGFRSLSIQTEQLYPYNAARQALFAGQPIVDRNLFGAAAPV